MPSAQSDILSLLADIRRAGIDNLIAYMEESDYFSAHCHHHHRYAGGLAEHSLGVYHAMRAMAPELPDESCRIAALCHDLCTTRLVGFDAVGYHRHGQRSVDLLDALGFDLHDDERLAICRHMHHVPFSACCDSTRLWEVLHLCDKRNAKDQRLSLME
jgi:hypothetical protein